VKDMEYNFSRIINRKGSNSSKWDNIKNVFGTEDLLPMWVADSDWPTAPVILEAMRKRLEHGIFGYTFPGEELNDVIVKWVKRRYKWDIKADWIVYTNGVVNSLNIAIKSWTHPGDDVIVQTPVYYPFFTSIKNNGCNILNNVLIYDNGKYIIDFEDLELKLKDAEKRIKLLILCNPHNPVSRVWTEEEQKRLGELSLKYNVLVISDEIHADFIFKGYQHIPFASISSDFARNSITFMAPSKTFNIAGLSTSLAIISDPYLRKEFMDMKAGILNEGNIFGLTAMKAAYENGEDWLEAQLDYLEGNKDFAIKYINEEIPQIKVAKIEGTYLLWLDFRALKLAQKDLNEMFLNVARLGLDFGDWFGPGGEGFARFNLAAPRSIIEDGLQRIKKMVNKI